MPRVLICDDAEIEGAATALKMWIGQNKTKEDTEALRYSDQLVYDGLPGDFRKAMQNAPIEITASSVRACINYYGVNAAYLALCRVIAEWLKTQGNFA